MLDDYVLRDCEVLRWLIRAPDPNFLARGRVDEFGHLIDETAIFIVRCGVILVRADIDFLSSGTRGGTQPRAPLR
jgi:hypothetical protein